MRKVTLAEARQIELDLLLCFSELCEKYNLTYYLAYGTLLGAVRHKGFIPWDDDIDVFMPRKDYDKLRSLMSTELCGAEFFGVDPSDKISRHTIIKIMNQHTVKKENCLDYADGTLGVDIDIFPLDGVPEREEEFCKWHKKLVKIYLKHLYKELRFAGTFKRNLKMLVQKIVYGCWFISREKIFRKVDKLHSLYPYEECEYVGCFETYCMEENNRLKKEWFNKTVMLEFEGHQFRAPEGYHQVLTQLYGDYMKLPPKELQVNHHGNNMFWKEEQ